MLGDINKLIIKIIILVLIKFALIFQLAQAETIVYFCKFSNGIIGYYDRPCEYINMLFSRTSKDQVEDNSKTLSILDEYVVSEKINDSKQKKANLARVVSMTNKCTNAVEKIAAIDNLLINKYLNSHSNYEKILEKLKKSLARYKRIKKQYCN